MRRLVASIVLWAIVIGDPGRLWAQPKLDCIHHEDRIEMKLDDRPLGTFVFKDPAILRPYLMNVTVRGSVPVTRHHPPRPGMDAMDHDTMHPGVWLAFSSLGGHDFWRNKDRVVAQDVEIERPGPRNVANISATLRYLAKEVEIARDRLRLRVEAQSPSLIVFDWTSEMTADQDVVFADVEEMGLGIRIATPMTVKSGGRITNSNGDLNEKEVRGRAADWCDYSGTIDGVPAGLTIIPWKSNLRRSYFHARDYGMLAANPFGVRSFTGGDDGSYRLKAGETLRLGFRVVAHAGAFSPAEFVSKNAGSSTQ